MIAEYLYELLPADFPKVIGDLPATKKEVVCIMEYSGTSNTEYFGMKDDSTIYSPIIKIVIRHSSYETGKSWVDIIKNTLHKYHDDTLLSVLMVNSPIYLGKSPEKLHEFQITFKIQTEEDNL